LNKKKETVIKMRRHFKITVDGDDPAEPVCTFEAMDRRFNFSKHFMSSITAQNYTEPTPVQI